MKILLLEGILLFLHEASLVNKNKVSLTDYLTKFYDRYSKVEPYISAFIQEDNFKARLTSDASSLLKKFPDEKPPFFGAPIAIKDLIHVDGFPTLAGSKLPSNALTSREGSFISNLRSMGAVFVGKTVTEEFAYHSVTPTRNPHNIEHTPGGPSAGSAASVAAGICPIAVGTQVPTLDNCSCLFLWCGWI